MGDVRCFLARIKPKNGLRRDLREVLLDEIASLDETETCVGRATELRFGLPLGVLGNNAPGPRYAAGQRCSWAVKTLRVCFSNAFPDPN